MLTVSKSGRCYIPGKPLSSDLRHIIIDKIIDGGGNPLTMIFPGRFINLVSIENASVLARDPLLPSQSCFLLCEYQNLGPAKRIQRLLFWCSWLLCLTNCSSASWNTFWTNLRIDSFIFLYCKSQWIHPSEMGHLVHNAFYELAVFQAHKLFFDNIYWSYSFCRIVGVFYLDFNRHDMQIDKTRRLFPSPPSNAW